MSVDLLNNDFWVRKATAAFRRLDLNKDGTLSRDDMKIFQERAVQLANMTPHQIEVFAKKNAELIALSFGDNDHHITLEEFLSVNSKNADQIGTSTIPDMMFDIIDTDNDGEISAHEYAVFFQIVGFDQKLVPEAFQAIDADKDGTISRKEFADAYVEYCKGTDESHPSRHMFGHM